MASKNFLDQFSTNNKPDSFKEEVLVPASKPKKPLNITVLIVLAVVVLLGGFSIWFFVLRPTIEVPSFIGLEISDINSWIKQQGIEPAGVVIKDEYSDEYEQKKIVYQSIEEGKKVKKNVKIDFVVSNGPDPNTIIVVPDISSMNLSSINMWIADNKLTGVKLSYEFSDEDPTDSVITYEFGNGASETSFKRSSNLSITISKGKQEDQSISVPNFNNKNYTDVTNWGSKNKIKIVKKEEYSSTVNKDVVISQSVNPGKKITSKESLTVTISKGAPIMAPDFSSYSRENITAWGTKNGVNIEFIEKYSKDVEKDKVIEQSIKNAACNDGMTVTISLGDISKNDLQCTTLDELKAKINDFNKNGAGLSHEVEKREYSDSVEPGNIISISNVSVGSKVKVVISRGRNIYIDPEKKVRVTENEGNGYKWPDEGELGDYNESIMRDLCRELDLTCSFSYKDDEEKNASDVISINRSDAKKNETGFPKPRTYVPQDVTINILIDNNTKEGGASE